MEISGNLVDIHKRKTYKAKIKITDGKIVSVSETDFADDVYILPGMADAHVHIESSMMRPQKFAQAVAKHGTISVVADPHEIANVMGMPGVKFMIEDAEKSPLKLFFSAPSCVPATGFETSGAKLDADDIELLLKDERVVALAEMMNFPGILNNDPDVISKTEKAKFAGKPIDGHAPGLSGNSLKKYIESGISTDHEAVNIQEAREKIQQGMYIQIREGSAAKNFEELIPLIKEYPDKIMFCTDDAHPNMLQHKHILDLVKRGTKKGYNLYDLLRAASLNIINHYRLPVGLLREGDDADFITVNNLEDFKLKAVYINGKRVTDNDFVTTELPNGMNNFQAKVIQAESIGQKPKSDKVRIITAHDRELYTDSEIVFTDSSADNFESDIEQDILKLVVLNRYQAYAKPSIAYIKGFGLRSGAIASSVAHDSHNIIAVGTNDADIIKAVNALIQHKGGLTVADGDDLMVLPLSIGGLMSDSQPEVLLKQYNAIKQKVKELGCKFQSPFMTLSFMALPVIPKIKLTDTGLFDVESMSFISVFV